MHAKTPTPLSEFDERRAKLKRLEEQNINPYPAQAEQKDMIDAVVSRFAELEETQETVTVCGRLRSKRTHGN
ncbi:MAG: hypothetical protein CR954_00645, partial [Candidatus Moraniibacteriota bacterium]